MTGPELRAARERLGLSKAALARRLGYRREAVSRYEHGHQTIPPVVALAVKALEAEKEGA